MASTREGSMSVWYLLIVAVAILGHSTIAENTSDSQCSRQYLMCKCGKTKPLVGVIVETCFNNQSNSCQLCNGLLEKDVCSRFTGCGKCSEGVDRCIECPERKAGKWCEYDCTCANDGVCDENGTCICQSGFTGIHCEQVVENSEHDRAYNDQRRTHNTVKRQTADIAISCPVLPAPDKGYVHLESNEPAVGEAVKYTCQENFTMLGSRTRHCQKSGRWAGEAPTCEKMCPFPPITSYLKVQINPGRIGQPLYDSFNNEIISELQFSCDFGYTVVGASRIRCASGVWDQDVPTCRIQVDCDDPGIPDNAEREILGPTREAFKVGTQLSFRCKGNLTLVGDAKLTCMPFRSWSAPLPVCLPRVISECSCTCKSPSGASGALQQVKEPMTCSTESQPDAKIVLNP